MTFSTLTGYRRSDHRYGVRNLVCVMAAADNANPLARKLADAVPGTVCLPASYGRGQLGADLETTLDTLAGLAAHPNVAGCLIVAFDAESARRIARRATALGRRVETLSLLDEGGLSPALARGAAMLERLHAVARDFAREPMRPEDLVIGLECGGSDTSSGLFGNPAAGLFADRFLAAGGTAIFSEPVECLGGEAALSERAVNGQVARDIMAAIDGFQQIALSQGIDFTGINPTADNIAGGLTTIEEKSLGAIAKTGSEPIQGVLGYAERPAGSGLWMMDAPAAAVENLTALAAGGAQLILFVTGSCNPIGHPVSPTIKICANPETTGRMAEHIDVDISMGISADMTLDAAADAIGGRLAAVADGGATAAERTGYLETNISRFGLSV